MARALAIEAELRHDLMAEMRTFAEQCPVGGPIIHLGATSMDIEDNADVPCACARRWTCCWSSCAAAAGVRRPDRGVADRRRWPSPISSRPSRPRWAIG